MFVFSSHPTRRRDTRFRPAADLLDERIAPTAGTLPAPIEIPDTGWYSGPIYDGGDQTVGVRANMDPACLPPVSI